jgi:hypothetical protein
MLPATIAEGPAAHQLLRPPTPKRPAEPPARRRSWRRFGWLVLFAGVILGWTIARAILRSRAALTQPTIGTSTTSAVTPEAPPRPGDATAPPPRPSSGAGLVRPPPR